MPNQPIPIIEANNMIKAYNTYMQTLGVDMQKQTQSVGFKLTELLVWLNKMTGVADEIRICMGDYPDSNPQAGRTTVILWPFKNGQPAVYPANLPIESEDPGNGDEEGDDGDGGGKGVDPYNDGQLHP